MLIMSQKQNKKLCKTDMAGTEIVPAISVNVHIVNISLSGYFRIISLPKGISHPHSADISL